MLRIEMKLCCDLCGDGLQSSEVCFEEPEETDWSSVWKELESRSERLCWNIQLKWICTPCVSLVDTDAVCLLP